MTVVVLKLKGGGDTLRKGFDALTSAFASLGPGTVITKRTHPALSKQLNGTVAEQAPTEGEPDVEEELATIDAAPASSSPPGRTPPQRKPKFLTEFDLTAGTTNWRDFAGARAPKSDNEKYLLAALWITEEAKVADFTVGHVFTCFRAMKWNEQVDFSQPLRQMKHNSLWCKSRYLPEKIERYPQESFVKSRYGDGNAQGSRAARGSVGGIYG
ncbi:MAG TPA: hypothetical protein VN776_00730, partial [Terracidiphilus sp.]|nr:hypothetical protein [Terracidiphilus sp.]